MKKIVIITIALFALAAVGIVICLPLMQGIKNKAQNGNSGADQKNRIILLYYYNPNNDKDESGNIKCSRAGLAPVERKIPATKTPVKDAISLLLRGDLSQSEKESGIYTEFPLAGVELKSANLQNEILTLNFSDPQNKTGGGACRAQILWFQIEATAKQFESVEQVRFIPEELFQP